MTDVKCQVRSIEIIVPLIARVETGINKLCTQIRDHNREIVIKLSTGTFRRPVFVRGNLTKNVSDRSSIR